MTPKDMWERFVALHPENATFLYEAWAYGDMPDELADLTVRGVKTATASALALYALAGEELPQEGDFSVILDSHGEAVCIIRNVRVRILPFQDVDERQAILEGEGDLSLSWWRKAHEAFFQRELAEHNLLFTEDIAVVCEEFEVVHP